MCVDKNNANISPVSEYNIVKTFSRSFTCKGLLVAELFKNCYLCPSFADPELGNITEKKLIVVDIIGVSLETELLPLFRVMVFLIYIFTLNPSRFCQAHEFTV